MYFCFWWVVSCWRLSSLVPKRALLLPARDMFRQWLLLWMGGIMQKVEAGTGCRPRQVIQRKNVVEIVIREGIKIAMDSGIYAIWSGR